MTTIKSTDRSASIFVERSTVTPDTVLISGSRYPRAEVLDALDAVDKDRFEKVVRSRVDDMMNTKRQYWIAAGDHQRLTDEFRTRAEKAEGLASNWERMASTHLEQKHAMEDKLAEAEATIERVKAVAEKWRYKGEFGWGPWQAGEGPDPEGQILDDAASELRAALDPKPAFVLPTEAGVSFTAKNGIGEEVTFCSVWNITKDGDAVLYVNNHDYLYNGDDVLKIFTDLRLLNAALNEEGDDRG